MPAVKGTPPRGKLWSTYSNKKAQLKAKGIILKSSAIKSLSIMDTATMRKIPLIEELINEGEPLSNINQINVAKAVINECLRECPDRM